MSAGIVSADFKQALVHTTLLYHSAAATPSSFVPERPSSRYKLEPRQPSCPACAEDQANTGAGGYSPSGEQYTGGDSAPGATRGGGGSGYGAADSGYSTHTPGAIPLSPHIPATQICLGTTCIPRCPQACMPLAQLSAIIGMGLRPCHASISEQLSIDPQLKNWSIYQKRVL